MQARNRNSNRSWNRSWNRNRSQSRNGAARPGTWPLAAVAVALLVGASLAQGQGTKPPGTGPARPASGPRPAPTPAAESVLQERPLQEALDEATARHRLLIVVANPSREKDKQAQELWANPALREWVKRHAIAVRVTDRDTMKVLQDAKLICNLPDQPLIFRGGKQERLFGSVVRDDGLPGGVRIRQAPKEARVQAEAGRPNTSLRMLLRLEWTLRSFKTRDPEWFARHEASNPPVQAGRDAAAPATLFDRLPAPVSGAPSKDFGEDGACDPVARYIAAIQAATTMAGAADGGGAGGGGVGGGGVNKARLPALTAWLWERGPTESPAFLPTSLGALPRWSHTLGREDPGVRSALKALKDARTGEIPGMDDRGLFTYLMLARTIDEHLETLDLLDAALDDADARTMLSAGDREVYELMLPRLNWVDPWTAPGADGDALTALKRIRDAARGVGKPAKPGDKGGSGGSGAAETDRVRGFARWLLAVEGCRTYAACLSAQREDEAKRVAELLMTERELGAIFGDGGGSEWLVTSAACVGQVRAEHVAWLGEPTTASGKRLLARVKAHLAAGGQPGK